MGWRFGAWVNTGCLVLNTDGKINWAMALYACVLVYCLTEVIAEEIRNGSRIA